jgi:DNA-binding transcriptional regulator YiaG
MFFAFAGSQSEYFDGGAARNEMKKNPRIGQRIKKFREDHYASQKALADALGLRQTVVSAWETGDNVPSCEAWVKLASVAPSPDNLWFLRQAGLDREIIIAAAKTLGENAMIRPKEGEMVLIPRFRVTEHGREEAGPPVPLPSEFIANPLATLCLLTDAESTGVIDAPKGLTILDTSIEGTQDLTDLWNRVVALYFTPTPGLTGPDPEGIYVGRLLLDGHTWPRQPDAAVMRASLQSLVEWRWALSDIGYYHEDEAFKGIAPNDHVAIVQRWAEVRERAISKFKFSRGIKILGKVIGRLTGHIGK